MRRPGQPTDARRSRLETPRLGSPKAGSGAGIDGAAKSGAAGAARGVRTWLAAFPQPARGGAQDLESARLSVDGADVAATTGGGGGDFWMRALPAEEEALPALPGEGAQGTDPYLRVSESMQRNTSAPPTRSPPL